MRGSIRANTAACMAAAFILAVSLPALAGPSGAASPGAGAALNGTGTGLGLVPSRLDMSRKSGFSASSLNGGAGFASSRDLSADLPPIGNQGAYQSCVGWAAGYYGKTWHEKQEHPDWDLGDRKHQSSPQYLWNGINGGTNAGTSFYDAFSYLEYYGCADWEQFPYDGKSYDVQPDATTIAAGQQYRIAKDWGWFFLRDNKGAGVISDLKAWLDGGKPLVMGIPIYADFPDLNGNPRRSYYNHTGGGGSLGGHGVFIAGYNDNAGGLGRGGFLMINSWGPNWNGNGKVYLSYDFVRGYAWEAWHMSDRDSSPRIEALTPSFGAMNQLVTIEGDNFGGRRRMARIGFHGAEASSIVNWANDRIMLRVPTGSRSGIVRVYDWESESSGGKAFSVGPPSNAAADWLLAEGSTWPGFDEWVLLQNPSGETSTVKINFLTPGGEVDGPSVGVPGMSRVTLHVNEYVPNADVSTAITVTAGPKVCAERAMYFYGTNGKWGSHDSIPAMGVAETWYLAEGATWPGYDEWILIMNPFDDKVSARITFQTPEGEVKGPALTLPGNTRRNVHVNDFVSNSDVSAKVECATEGYGLVAERSMFINAPDGKVDCHNSLGASEAASAWGLPEGATWRGFEEWVLIQNPTGRNVETQTYFLTPKKVVEGPRIFVMPGGRESIRVNDWVPNNDVSTLVFTGSEDQSIVVERAQYMSGLKGKRGGHNSPGSIYSSKDWLLPEGCTFPGFEEWVLIMNPDTQQTAQVSLTFMTSGGEVKGPRASVAPAARASFCVNKYVATEVSTRVTSDSYVIAERAMYLNTPQGKQGATCSLGIPTTMLGGSGEFGAGVCRESLLRLRRRVGGG